MVPSLNKIEYQYTDFKYIITIFRKIMKSKPHFIDHDIIIHFSGYMYFANLSFKKLFSGKRNAFSNSNSYFNNLIFDKLRFRVGVHYFEM